MWRRRHVGGSSFIHFLFSSFFFYRKGGSANSQKRKIRKTGKESPLIAAPTRENNEKEDKIMPQ